MGNLAAAEPFCGRAATPFACPVHSDLGWPSGRPFLVRPPVPSHRFTRRRAARKLTSVTEANANWGGRRVALFLCRSRLPQRENRTGRDPECHAQQKAER